MKGLRQMTQDYRREAIRDQILPAQSKMARCDIDELQRVWDMLENVSCDHHVIFAMQNASITHIWGSI